MTKKRAESGVYQAPPGSRHEWHDRAGGHEVVIADDGLFTPSDPAEHALAKRRGWPAAAVAKPTDEPAAPEKEPPSDG